MEFFVYSRPVFETVGGNHNVPHVVVSINCPGDEPAKFEANDLTLGRVNLFFWDLDAVPYGQDTICENYFLCEPEDAQKIVDLIDANPEAQRVIVHCTAGKSRSAAVAAALMKSINGDDSPIFNNPRYKPNMRVYRMVLNAWYDKHSDL